MYSMRHLEIMAELPEHRTLGSAADELHISESALSQAISTIEKLAGETLCLRRKAHGFTLTASGAHFSAMARKIIAEVTELAATFPQREGVLRGPVRFGCFASLSPHLIPATMQGFEHPQVQLTVQVGTNETLVPALRSAELDVAFVYDLGLPPDMDKQPIYQTAMQAVLHPEHPLAQLQRPLQLEDLMHEPLVMYESDPSTNYVRQLFAARGLNPRIIAEVPQMILVSAMVGRGLGYGLMMRRPNNAEMSLEGRPLAFRELQVPALPGAPAAHSSVVAITPRSVKIPARVQALIDHCRAAMEDSW
ncbi:LysR family transcriptional regulator [Glutamicibacter uratoxydans]|uniref:LysR family transcriptional regulator n=1 Tax=Glutamicibacter uratoxydans TaxID=43667 RepID=A0A4Y4DKD4_GLUUR|nr:LysR family transcriptional regulator [Glutamicibacter uratoxydans]GED05426.1 LysR family transcriptional regulator [Glutamicibacter uratoxydans]